MSRPHKACLRCAKRRSKCEVTSDSPHCQRCLFYNYHCSIVSLSTPPSALSILERIATFEAATEAVLAHKELPDLASIVLPSSKRPVSAINSDVFRPFAPVNGEVDGSDLERVTTLRDIAEGVFDQNDFGGSSSNVLDSGFLATSALGNLPLNQHIPGSGAHPSSRVVDWLESTIGGVPAHNRTREELSHQADFQPGISNTQLRITPYQGTISHHSRVNDIEKALIYVLRGMRIFNFNSFDTKTNEQISSTAVTIDHAQVEALIARIENAHQQIKGSKRISQRVDNSTEIEEKNASADDATSKIPHNKVADVAPGYASNGQEENVEKDKKEASTSIPRRKNGRVSKLQSQSHSQSHEDPGVPNLNSLNDYSLTTPQNDYNHYSGACAATEMGMERAEDSIPSLDDPKAPGIIVESATTLEDSEVKTPNLDATNVTLSISEYDQSVKSDIAVQAPGLHDPIVSTNVDLDVQQTLEAFNEVVEAGHVEHLVFDLDEFLRASHPDESESEYQLPVNQIIEVTDNDPISTWSSLEMPERHWPAAFDGTPADTDFTAFPDLQASQELREWLAPSTDVVEEEIKSYGGLELVEESERHQDPSDAVL